MITVIAATYNGAHTLPRFLDSMAAQSTDEPWKLLLVDNASTDESARIIKSYKDRLPLTYLFEAKKGKNAAINQALSCIEGDLVVLTDDDVIAAPDWLTNYRAAVDQQPDFDVFGGTIRPYWEGEPSELHLECVPQGPVYALTRHEWEDGPCSPYNIWGPNMAIRARVFSAGYRFDEQVGPNSGENNYMMGSETSFTSLLAAKGYKSFHISSPSVQHIIRARQMAPVWIYGRAIRYGRSLFSPPTHYQPKRFFGYPIYICIELLFCYVKYLLSYMSLNRKLVYQYKWSVNVSKGKLFQSKSVFDPRISKDGSVSKS
ncbi:glycosyltransferase family 2 protein [Motiliproteus sp. SC1-56]|uniref:glycosyltransferase family 2 protein n=1 Tax=Motiliproteus sp. SC1-56 TaxID=2799565 RepID=UPI001A8F4D1E|nr:glycosyltransferase family 2 protein [Motiliproteus sp. SC1-56]